MRKKLSKSSLCEKAILDTLAYKAVFGYSPSFYQLANSLICKHKFDINDVSSALKHLVSTKKVTKKKERYFLTGQKVKNWEQRAANSIKRLKEEQKNLQLLSTIPWIKMIGITGSVSAYNANPEDDVDLLIVTQQNRVWLTRGFVAVFLILLNKYPRKETKNKLCPNIYIAENNLEWAKEKQNLYVANDILMLRPVFSKDEMYFSFLHNNAWVKKYFANFPVGYKVKQIKPPKQSGTINSLEETARKLQQKYMKTKKTKEVTTKQIIHFNKNDSTQKVLNKFQKNKKIS